MKRYNANKITKTTVSGRQEASALMTEKSSLYESRLGAVVNPAWTMGQNLEAAGLNWGTVTRPLGWMNQKTGVYNAIDDRFAVIRTDNGAVLDSGVSGQFQPNHNREIVKFLNRIGEGGEVRLTHLRSIDGGRYVVAYATIGVEDQAVAVGDKVRTLLRVCIPHVSGMSITSSIEVVRLKCTNGMVAGECGGRWSMTHKQAFGEDAQLAALKGLNLRATANTMVKQFRALASVQAKPADIRSWAHELTTGERVMRQILGEAQDGPVDMLEAATQATVAASLTRDDLNRAGAAILDSVTNSPGWDTAPGTWWAALNGATYYYDHKYGRSEDSRATAGVVGTTGKAKRRALELALNYAGIEASATL
jgi:hypothetical protein